jgi:signal peptide peptidase SppA
MAPIPFRTPPPQGGHVLGQPFTITDLSIPVNCMFTCNCGDPALRTALTIVASAPVMCPQCHKAYGVAFNPANNQVMVASIDHRRTGALMKYLHIARYVSSTLWAITPEKMAELVDVLAFRAAGHTFSADEIRARIGDGGSSAAGATKRGGVAVIPIRGTIAHRMNGMDDSSGGTSAERIGAMLDQVAADASIGTVVYDIDSPGGTVPGVQELAAKMFALRSSKTQIAQVNSLAASAAYWLASQADEIVSIPSGNTGSIGVFTAHQDLSKALEQAGVNVTLISAGKYKVEANPFEPLSDEAQAVMQARVDDAYGQFVKDVARGRGVTQTAVREGYGQGRVLGAKDALKGGLIDAIGTLEDTIGRVIGGPSAKTRGTRASSSARRLLL